MSRNVAITVFSRQKYQFFRHTTAAAIERSILLDQIGKKREKRGKKCYLFLSTAYTASSSCVFADCLSKPLNGRLNTLWLLFEIPELLQWSRSEHYWQQRLGASAGVAVHVCSVLGLCSCSGISLDLPFSAEIFDCCLVSQFKLYGSEAVFSFPWHCLREREPFWWIGDSRTLSSRFVFVFLQNHTGRFFSKCIFDKPFCPVPSLCFPLFSPSQTDDRRIWVFEEWDSSIIQILFASQTGTGVKKGASGWNPADGSNFRCWTGTLNFSTATDGVVFCILFGFIF